MTNSDSYRQAAVSCAVFTGKPVIAVTLVSLEVTVYIFHDSTQDGDSHFLKNLSDQHHQHLIEHFWDAVDSSHVSETMECPQKCSQIHSSESTIKHNCARICIISSQFCDFSCNNQPEVCSWAVFHMWRQC